MEALKSHHEFLVLVLTYSSGVQAEHIRMDGIMVEEYPGYELVKEEIGGIAGYMALYKLAYAPTLDLATGRYPLTEYGDIDVQKAMTEWRTKNADARPRLTHKELTSAPHWEMLKVQADFHI